MNGGQHRWIAREARPLVLALAAFGLGVYVAFGWPYAVAVVLILIGVVFLFRDPRRSIPPSPLAVVSPADGIVLDVREVHDDQLERQSIELRIGMNSTGVFTIRSPIEGRVMRQWYPTRSDERRRPHLPDTEQIAFAQWVQSDEGDDVVLTIERAPLMRRFASYVQSGERVGQGQRCGYVPLGSAVRLLLPSAVRVAVARGDRVRAGSDTLAKLVH